MMQNRRNWSDFEDKAILALVKKYGTKNWAEISEKMSSKYGIETRTGKQCRERWHNHLSPSVNKKPWAQKEEKIMFEAHQKYGNKWTEIAKNFEGRTDNDIKNHFYSMLRRSLRRVNKLLGMRNSTQKIRQIKPSVLSKIFSKNGNNNNKNQSQQDWRKISQYLFQFSRSKSGDDLSNNLEEDQKRKLQDLIQKISKYNQQYETSQLIKRQSRKSSKKENQEQSEQQQQLQQIFSIKKKSSNNSNQNIKTKKIKKPLKKASLQTQKSKQKAENKKNRKQKKVKQQNQQQIDDVKGRIQQNNQQRLIKKQSQFSLHMEEQFMFQLPQLQDISKRKSSNMDSRRASSSNSSSFCLGSFSPRMDLRFLSRTPQWPTPNITDLFSKNLYNTQLKTNKQDLDNILNQTKKSIQRKTNNS